ncbi:MAG: Ldh family oxidoreductase [Rhodospirillaceae bacterium]|jgi:LDH2 family malate/lactate/ureidoglycolate dehydrogenase|nr:Ldh family oxidoreductase [Rhodospirillaceae bacterium]
MARYPGSELERRIPEAALRQAVQNVYEGCGMSSGDAETVARSLVHADLRGIHSHGVMRVPGYAGRLTNRGGINPTGQPKIAKDAGAALVVDGDNAMGQVVANFAMRQVIERARTTGTCVAAVGGSNHCGAMDFYALMALEEDMIGLATTNALPTMAPWGGSERILGINPLAIAMPSNQDIPVVMDFSFGATARGRIQVLHQKGLPLPEGWALDKDGAPTTDTAAALEGLIAPAGDFKGTALAMTMGLLSTVMSGASYGTKMGSVDDGPNCGEDGQFVMAIDAGKLEDIATVKARTDAVIEELRACRVAPGFDRVVPAGFNEEELEREYRRDGIPLNDATISGIRATADEVGADASMLA